MMRPPAAERGYGSAWRKVRAVVLARDPVCCVDGCDAPSEHVDHAISKHEGGNDDPSNLRGMCAFHHYRLTGQQRQRWRQQRRFPAR